MTNFNHEQWHVDHSIDRFKEQADSMAYRLRQLADDIERDSYRILDADRKYADEIVRSSWIVNAVNHAFANLSTQDLIVRAAELKQARDAVESERRNG